MARHDDQHAAVTAKARTKHVTATGDAARAFDKVTEAAAAALQAAREKHDKAVADAEQARKSAEQAAHAELARVSKQALADWTQAEREVLGVPEAAFIRKDFAGRFTVHAGPGVPAAATAWANGPAEWIVESEGGRAFVGGDELVMRRRLFQALMAPFAAIEDSEAA